MELAWIKTFVKVAELENFRKSSEVLFVSQPTVTVHIKALEKELGVTLFERGKRSVKLTEEGRTYLGYAKQLLELYREGVEKVQSVHQGYREQLRLAISPQIADTIMPFVLKEYLVENPDVEIVVNVTDSINIEKAVLQEDVDLGFTLLESQEKILKQQVLYEDQVVFCAPHDGFDVETAPAQDPEQLFREYHLLTHNHPVYWNLLLSRIQSKYNNIKMMKVSQNHITKRFIISGLGVSFLPKSTIRRELLEGRILEINLQDFDLPIVKTYAIMKYEHELEMSFLKFVERYHFQ